jgi:DNA-binding transcriptional regulator YiaG
MRPQIFKLLREFLNESQVSLGAKLNVSHTTVYLWESGRLRIPPEISEQLVSMVTPQTAKQLGYGLGMALAQW